ncbi:MAG: toprim domain-containing protein [Oscillibacter sp.]|nr:toprim domain-containing protein [Oscillibacter sp.]
MSFCTLCPEIHSNAVALCGLYSGPLDTYLKDHPHLKAIKLLPDNGEPGIAAAKEMRGRYREAGYEVEIRVPKYGKDWNAQLKYKLMGGLEEVKQSNSKEKPQKKEPSALRAAALAGRTAPQSSMPCPTYSLGRLAATSAPEKRAKPAPTKIRSSSGIQTLRAKAGNPMPKTMPPDPENPDSDGCPDQ